MALKNYFIFDQFKVIKFRVVPINKVSAYLHFFNNLACIFPILTNYICFYFIIKNSYKKPTPVEENLIIKDDFISLSNSGNKNNDIEDYLN